MKHPISFLLVAIPALAVTGILISQHTQAAKPLASPQIPIPPPYPTPTATPPPLPVAPLHGTLPGWLRTDGTRVVDVGGHTVRLVAINWYGAETPDFVPGGLAYRPYISILRTIKYLGFNSVRIPFSNELVERNPNVTAHLEANPWFHNMHALDILDSIIKAAGQVGLMVILDDHRSQAGWTAQENGLWYDLPTYTYGGWIKDWIAMARRYKDNPAVVGYDLRNEPHSHGPGQELVSVGYLHQGATWGPFLGVDNPASDWRLAAEQAGNAILAVNPHALIMVEGTQIYPTPDPLKGAYCPFNIPATSGYCEDSYWWGGNLAGVKQSPGP